VDLPTLLELIVIETFSVQEREATRKARQEEMQALNEAKRALIQQSL
jgi:hypothetical protein